MLSESSLSRIRRLRDALNTHRVYQAVQTPDDLRAFMAHHVYAVWDFMSLLKFLQQELAPSRQPWTLGANTVVRRFINEIVLDEESDNLAQLEEFIDKPIKLQPESLYTQEQYDVVLM